MKKAIFLLSIISLLSAKTNDIQDTQTCKDMLKTTYIGTAGGGILEAAATTGYVSETELLEDLAYSDSGKKYISDTITRFKDTVSRRVSDSLDSLRAHGGVYHGVDSGYFGIGHNGAKTTWLTSILQQDKDTLKSHSMTLSNRFGLGANFNFTDYQFDMPNGRMHVMDSGAGGWAIFAEESYYMGGGAIYGKAYSDIGVKGHFCGPGTPAYAVFGYCDSGGIAVGGIDTGWNEGIGGYFLGKKYGCQASGDTYDFYGEWKSYLDSLKTHIASAVLKAEADSDVVACALLADYAYNDSASRRINDSIARFADSLAAKLPLHGKADSAVLSDLSDSCTGGAVRADSAKKVPASYTAGGTWNFDSVFSTKGYNTTGNYYKNGVVFVPDSSKRSGTCAVADSSKKVDSSRVSGFSHDVDSAKSRFYVVDTSYFLKFIALGTHTQTMPTGTGIFMNGAYTFRIGAGDGDARFGGYLKGDYISGYGLMTFGAKNNAADIDVATIKSTGLGIFTRNPTYALSLGGQAGRAIWMERDTTANTAGQNLTIQSGGATVGATDKSGGTLYLKPGVSTGTGTGQVVIYTCPRGATGTSDNTPVVSATFGNNGKLTLSDSFVVTNLPNDFANRRMVTANASNFLSYRDLNNPISLYDAPHGQYVMYTPQMNNLLYGGSSRFDVTMTGFSAYSSYYLFDGDYDDYSNNRITTDSTWGTTVIGLVSKGEYGTGGGLTYSNGYIYVHFYSKGGIDTVRARFKTKNGGSEFIWREYHYGTNIAVSSASVLSKIDMGGANYYCDSIEIGVKSGVLTTESDPEYTISVSEIEFIVTRSCDSRAQPLVNKTIANSLYNTTSWKNSSNVTTASISTAGKGVFDSLFSTKYYNTTSGYYLNGAPWVPDTCKRSGTSAVAAAWTHGVTTNYVPYANAATTMAASPIKIGSGTSVGVSNGDDKDNGPTIALYGTLVNQTESGRIRMTEANPISSPYYQGAYMHYNGATNMFYLGTHNAITAVTADDINVISIPRAGTSITITPAATFSSTISATRGTFSDTLKGTVSKISLVSISTKDSTAELDVTGMGRFQASNVYFNSNVDAVTVGYYAAGNSGYVWSYNWGAATYLPLNICGSVVNLQHGGVTKLATTATGINVAGDIVADSLFANGKGINTTVGYYLNGAPWVPDTCKRSGTSAVADSTAKVPANYTAWDWTFDSLYIRKMLCRDTGVFNGLQTAFLKVADTAYPTFTAVFGINPNGLSIENDGGCDISFSTSRNFKITATDTTTISTDVVILNNSGIEVSGDVFSYSNIVGDTLQGGHNSADGTHGITNSDTTGCGETPCVEPYITEIGVFDSSLRVIYLNQGGEGGYVYLQFKNGLCTYMSGGAYP